jgi:hypothetical protein
VLPEVQLQEKYQAKSIPDRNDLILAEIESVAAEIVMIIERLRHDQDVTYFRYAMIPAKLASHGLPTFEIAEQMVTESSLIRLKQWRRNQTPEIKALQVDLFNCKTPFKASHTVDEMEKLNDAQLDEARRYAFFGEAAQCRAPLAVFLENSRVMLWHLNQACQLLNDSPSELERHQEKIRSINKQIEDLHLCGVQGSFCQPLQLFVGSAQYVENIFSWVKARTTVQPSEAKPVCSFRPAGANWSVWSQLISENRSRLLFVFKTTTNHLFGYFLNSIFQSSENCSDQHTGFLFTLSNPHGIQPTVFAKHPFNCGTMFSNNSHRLYLVHTDANQGQFQIGLEHDFQGRGQSGRAQSGFQNSKHGVDIFFKNDGLIKFGFNSNGAYPDTTGKGNLLFTGTAEAMLIECIVYQL